MSVVGPSYGKKIEIAKFKTPENYISGKRRDYHPGPQDRVFNYWFTRIELVSLKFVILIK